MINGDNMFDRGDEDNYLIDFVVLWVDGNDPKWLAEKSKYKPAFDSDVRIQRYRDWDNLKYWFRSVEKNASWVNHVFFVTWGHLPKWLNTNNPKLRVIKHEDFMNPDYLPVFNCNPLELSLNKIKGLSEHFVYFNDDIFIIKKSKRTDFFKNGLPCDSAVLNIHRIDISKTNNYASLQATGVINKYFDMHESIRKNWRKWINIKNGIKVLRTIYLLPCKAFPEILQIHMPTSFLKSVYDEVWDKEEKILVETCHNRFRNKLDYTQWTMRNWQIAEGCFTPRSIRFGKSFCIGIGQDAVEECVEYIKNKKGKVICINDGELSEKEFNICKQKINDALEELFPNKSSFEI